MQDVINKGYSSGLSKKTLSNMKACLLAFLKFCRSCKATTLFVEGLYVPKGAAVKEKRVLQPNDIKILFGSSKTIYKGKEIDDPLINRLQISSSYRTAPGRAYRLTVGRYKGRYRTFAQSHKRVRRDHKWQK